jgi:YesN/AraC family two-component response regulator
MERKNEYLEKERVVQAKILLLTTNEDIENIALRVGLNKRLFVSQFKKLVGKSPSKWRKNQTPEFKLFIKEEE